MILDLMRRRRSIRRYQPRAVPEETLLELVEAAITAPSPANRQPWRFLIVRSPARIADAADVVREESERLCARLRAEYKAHFESYGRHFLTFASAPVVIAPLYRAMEGLPQMLADQADAATAAVLEDVEHHGVLVSTGLAIQNLLLMAEERGLGACCLTGPLIAGPRLAQSLDVPEGWDVAALIAIGFPDEQPASPGRKPVATFVRWA